MGLVIVDESIRRTIVRRDGETPVQFRKNLFGQLLAEFDTPLIKRVDIPHGALDKDFHFVHGNETPEDAGCQAGEQNGIGGSVTGKDLVGDQRGGVGMAGEFLGDCLFRFAKRQGFRLGKKVGQENGMVIDGTIQGGGNVIVRLTGGQKIAGNQFRALVDQLVKGVLTVRTRFTPQDGARLERDGIAIQIDGFPVRFHITLLKVRSETVHVLIVGENSEGFGTKKVIVPNADHGQGQWQILARIRFRQKVLVHGVRTRVHFHPIVKPNGEGNGSTDRTPERVAAADL